MRAIGEIQNEEDAQRFGDYLLVEGIPNEIEEEDGEWVVWVHDDDHVEAASTALEEFIRNSSSPVFRRKSAQAARLRQKEKKEEEQARQRHIDVRTQVFNRMDAPPRLTYAVVGVCVLLHTLSLIGGFEWLRNSLYYSQVQVKGDRIVFHCPHCGEGVSTGVQAAGQLKDNCPSCGETIKTPPDRGALPEIRRGEIWRLATPVLLHSTDRSSGMFIMHILFNMYMFVFLAGAMERVLGRGHLLIFMLATALVSNFSQYAITGPNFVGMSGVVYALFGYIWLRSRFEPNSLFHMDSANVFILMGWFVLCFFGLMGNVANFAHAGGLVAGASWGYVAAHRL